MNDRWRERVAALGLTELAADLAARSFRSLAERFEERVRDPAAAHAWWVPGRIEVLGKHTDYGGGRSLLCTVERGFHVLATPRTDPVVRLVDASSGAMTTIRLTGDAQPKPGHWSDYPISVVRRIARDFPGAQIGMDAVVRSSLPSAAGLSSSSAFVIATFLPLAKFNALSDTAVWRAALGDPEAVAGYLGAVENGRVFGPFAADHGVGTHGGSEDQTAILCCRAGELSQYHFLPVTLEAAAPLPSGWLFAIAVSGVHAAKGGAAQTQYNHLARELAMMLELWCTVTGRPDRSLFAALRSAPDADDQLTALLRSRGAEALLPRLNQFRVECEELIPQVIAHLASGDVAGVGPLVDRSQSLAESALHNQTVETVYLARRARELGAAAASAFGAGFGGSVWALVPEGGAAAFIDRWREDYAKTHPARSVRADFFLTRPGPAAQAV